MERFVVGTSEIFWALNGVSHLKSAALSVAFCSHLEKEIPFFLYSSNFQNCLVTLGPTWVSFLAQRPGTPEAPPLRNFSIAVRGRGGVWGKALTKKVLKRYFGVPTYTGFTSMSGLPLAAGQEAIRWRGSWKHGGGGGEGSFSQTGSNHLFLP